MSKIEWTHRTWNPTTGCNKVSEGCKHCYAEVMHKRQMVLNPEKYAHPFLDGAFPHEPSLEVPLHWKKPAMIFVNSMSDLFHENIPFEFINKVFAVMALSPQHTFQILTKRPERAVEYSKWLMQQQTIQLLGLIANFPLPNVWIGTSVENQEQADKRIPYLLQIPAAVRFLSCEPLLGEVDLRQVGLDKQAYQALFPETAQSFVHTAHNSFDALYGDYKLHWVIVGGESGHGARPMHTDCARKIRDDCQAAGVAFFFKQWGEWVTTEQMPDKYYKELRNGSGKNWKIGNFMFGNDDRIFTFHKLTKKHTGRLLDGVEYSEYPNSEIAKGEIAK